MEQHKHTGKVALIDKAASFVYHLFMLESSVSVNKTEKTYPEAKDGHGSSQRKVKGFGDEATFKR